MSLVNRENGETKTRFSVIGAGRQIVAKNQSTSNALSPVAAPAVNANRRLLAATDIQPAGLEFLFPATIKMPLLRKQKPGSSIPLESLTASDNQYIPNGRTAIIASDGMSASASISRPGSFVLTSEKPVVSVTPSKITVEVGQPVQFNAND